MSTTANDDRSTTPDGIMLVEQLSRMHCVTESLRPLTMIVLCQQNISQATNNLKYEIEL